MKNREVSASVRRVTDAIEFSKPDRLPRGDKKEIEAHVKPLAELGADGGLIIGSASIGDDISPQTYDYYISLLDKYGQYR